MKPVPNQRMQPQVQWQWLRFKDLGVDNLYDLLALRSKVFILEQGPFLDPDGVDRHCWHLLGRDANGELHAYLRLVDPGIKYAEPSMGRVITSLVARGTGLGRSLVAQGMLLGDQVWPTHGNRISAQAHLAPFYAAFGYAAVGEPYIEDTIPHLEMLRPASVALKS
jgi:ElaA protein